MLNKEEMNLLIDGEMLRNFPMGISFILVKRPFRFTEGCKYLWSTFRCWFRRTLGHQNWTSPFWGY